MATDEELTREIFREYFDRDLPPLSDLPEGLFTDEADYQAYLKKVLYFNKSVVEPLERAGMKKEDRIIDIASGDGQMSVCLYLKGYREVVLFDLDEKRLKRGRRVIRSLVGDDANPETIRDSATNLAGKYNVLISYQTIEHLSDTGNYSVASRRCQKQFLAKVNGNVRRMCYFNAPNYRFPVDGHDTGIWFFHFLPISLRNWLISRKWVKCSWAGVAQPVSVGFLGRHLRKFRVASSYYAFGSMSEYLENYPPFNYMGKRMPNINPNSLSWKKRTVGYFAKAMGPRIQSFLPTVSVILKIKS